MKNLSITLVHGTWGNGFFRQGGTRRRWFNAGSPFVDSINQYFGEANIESFIWSGRNSFIERNNAAISLAELLSSQRDRYPDRHQLIISHSHGGNIVLRSLEYINYETNKIFIVTLATPFVEVFSASLSYRLNKALYHLRYLWIYMILIELIVGGAILFWVSNYDFIQNKFADILAIAFVGLILFISIITYYVFNDNIAVYENFSRERIRLLSQQSSHGPLSRFEGKLLILRSIDDEAALTLAVGSIGAKLSNIVISLFGFPLFHLFIFSYLLLFLAFVIESIFKVRLFTDSIGTFIMIIVMFSFVSIIIAPAIVLLTTLLSAVFQSVFGREILITPLICEVNSQSVPDNSEKAHIVTLVRSPHKSLRHGLYDHPHTVPTIEAWFRDNCKAM